MKTVMWANQKGGVGKSALATQFAHHLVSGGQRVLFVDLDHQANATKALGAHNEATVFPFSATEVLRGGAKPAIMAPLGLVRGDSGLGGLERLPHEHNGFVEALRDFLDHVARDYDVCLIDTNPNPDIRYAAAIISADFVICPIQLNQEAIDGIGGLLNHPRYGLNRIRATLNPTLNFLGILPNLVEPTPFQRANLEQLVRQYPQYLLVVQTQPMRFGLIPKRSAIAEAQADGCFVANMRKTAARDTWQEIRPVFEMLSRKICEEG